MVLQHLLMSQRRTSFLIPKVVLTHSPVWLNSDKGGFFLLFFFLKSSLLIDSPWKELAHRNTRSGKAAGRDVEDS